MAHILYRASVAPTVPSSTSAKGNGLTNLEIDGNWKSLNDGKLEIADAVSTNTNNKVVLRDGSGNFAAGTITAALSGNATTATTLQFSRNINGVAFNGSANITITSNTTNTLTIGSYLLGSDFNGSSATTWAVDATNLNTFGKIVARDASGNFAATTITANLTGNVTGNVTGALSGNATTATTLFNTRAINGTNFNGSADITVPLNTANDTATAVAVYPVWTTAAGNIAAKITTTRLSFVPSTGMLTATGFTGPLTGNASTATSAATLTTARTINGVSFNGSADINVPTQNTLTRGSFLTGNNFNGSAATTWAVDATSANTVSKVVARDGNGDFTAGVISATDFNSTSDRKFKENIESINNPLDILNNIQGVSFNWKANQKESFGVIAQDLQQVLPQLVSENEVGLTVSYIPLIGILIEAIKQQQVQIDELKALLS